MCTLWQGTIKQMEGLQHEVESLRADTKRHEEAKAAVQAEVQAAKDALHRESQERLAASHRSETDNAALRSQVCMFV
jgi:uncharacterized protein (DUF3084 family)